MRKYIAEILMFFMLINGIVPTTSYASGNKTIYNCGCKVYISQKIYNDEIYLYMDDLWDLEIEMEYCDSYIDLRTASKSVQIYYNSSIIVINGMHLNYNDPIINIYNKEYVSLQLIAMVFSPIYEVSDDSVNLWIMYYPQNYAKGIISLPSGEAAPPGGVEVTVYVAKERYNAGGGKAHPSIGYDGVYMYEENLFNKSVRNICEEKVIIEEGENSAEFFLSSTEDDFYTSCYIGYKVNSNGYIDEDSISFDFKNEKLYSFTLCDEKKTIEGCVEIASPAAENVRFCIIADGTSDFKYYGIIPKGETKADFIFSVKDRMKCDLKVIFADKKYMRTDFPETIKVSGENLTGIDFYCEDSKKTTVNISVQDDISEDVSLNFFLQSADEPYYYLDTRYVAIPAGEKNVTVDLIDDYGFENVICYYELSGTVNGLFDYGFYNSLGTVIELDETEVIKAGSEINVDLFEGNSIVLNFKLPEGYTAQSNIQADIQLRTAEGKKKYYEKSGACIVEYGNSEGTAIISVPKGCEKYYLRLFNITGDENYYQDIYYKNDNESTVFGDKAGVINVSDGTLAMTLMKQNIVSGSISGVPTGKIPVVWAIGQHDKNNKIGFEDSILNISVSEFGEDGAFKIGLPSEITEYIFMLKCGSESYYSDSGTVNNIESAGIVDVTEFPGSLNIVYEPEFPIELKAFKGNNDEINVNVSNVSSAVISNVNVFSAFYDKEGRLQKIQSYTINELNENIGENICFESADKMAKASHEVKIFAWNDKFNPLSQDVYYKKDGIGTAQKEAVLWMQSGNRMYCVDGKRYASDVAPEVIYGVLMSPLRPLSEAFAMTVEWDNETRKAVFTLDGNRLSVVVGSKTAFYNDEKFELSESPCIISDMTYVPVADIVKKFGYSAEFYSNTNELFVYSGGMDRLIKKASNRLVIPQTILEKNTDNYLSGIDAAEIIAAVCKVITAGEFEFDGSDIPDLITNEEFVKVMYNALNDIDVYISGSVEETEKFYDDVYIPASSKEMVYKMKAYGAFDSIYNTVFGAKDYITNGQAIALSENILSLAYDTIFPDISVHSVYRYPIIKLYRHGIISGYEDGTFRPDGFIYRSEFARLVSKILNEPDTVFEFECSDVSPDYWAKDFIGCCIANGIMELENNRFRPDECITNIEVISALLRFLGHYEDDDEIMDKALSLGMFEGIESLKPDGKSHRKNVAYLIWKALAIKGVL